MANCQRRGGNRREKSKHATNRMWDENQPYQQFFTAPGWKRYTAVTPAVAALPQSDGDGNPEAHADRLIRAQEATIIEEVRQRRTIDGSLDRLEPTPWLRFTAWHQHLAGFDRGQLLLSIRPTDDEREEDVGRVGQLDHRGRRRGSRFGASMPGHPSVDRASAEHGRVHIFSRTALEAAHRRECGVASNERPCYARQKVQTIRRYSRSWVKILRGTYGGRRGRKIDRCIG